eukprot:1150050-Pelagomonas_calceolata.AAC.1
MVHDLHGKVLQKPLEIDSTCNTWFSTSCRNQVWNSSLSTIILLSFLVTGPVFFLCRASLSLNFVVSGSCGLCTNVAP